MHIEHIRCAIEELAENIKKEFECGIENVCSEEMAQATDMLKDLCEAEYYGRISVAMEKAEEERESEEKYILNRMKEEYGDDEGEKRYYDSYRYANGRFAPKGRGTRRGYTTPYSMDVEDYKMHTPEYYRDMDKNTRGVMYYTEKMSGSETPNNSRDMREGRSGMSRRGYVETKQLHKGNSDGDNRANMASLEEYLKVLGEDMSELIGDMTNQEKTMLKTKLQTLAQKVI